MEIAGVLITSWSTVIFAWLWIAALFRANRIERKHRAAMEFARGQRYPSTFLKYWLAGDFAVIREIYPEFLQSLDDEAGA